MPAIGERAQTYNPGLVSEAQNAVASKLREQAEGTAAKMAFGDKIGGLLIGARDAWNVKRRITQIMASIHELQVVNTALGEDNKPDNLPVHLQKKIVGDAVLDMIRDDRAILGMVLNSEQMEALKIGVATIDTTIVANTKKRVGKRQVEQDEIADFIRSEDTPEVAKYQFLYYGMEQVKGRRGQFRKIEAFREDSPLELVLRAALRNTMINDRLKYNAQQVFLRTQEDRQATVVLAEARSRKNIKRIAVGTGLTVGTTGIGVLTESRFHLPEQALHIVRKQVWPAVIEFAKDHAPKSVSDFMSSEVLPFIAKQSFKVIGGVVTIGGTALTIGHNMLKFFINRNALQLIKKEALLLTKASKETTATTAVMELQHKALLKTLFP